MTFDFSSNHPSVHSLNEHHDTTNFFYRPQSSTATDIDDSVTLHKRRCRTNLRNAELSKRTFRIFLEKQILSHVEVEIRKNIHEAQTPLTPDFDYNKSDFTLNHARLLTLSPSLQTTVSGKTSIRNDLNLPNLEAEMYSSNRAIRISNAVITADSEINVYEDSVQNKSKVCTYTASTSNQNKFINLKINTTANKESHTFMYNTTSPEWFQDNEVVSVHGSLLSETISDSSHSVDLQRNTHHKRCRWRRILFCCIN
ncbi:uncharacterized protein LOC114930010 [Nylanderia fulva]|uniref:uncharacterized protein LOC114930010 n=1 Tax=Nylanderia fulva TaxID=613905 RepID=UPI0010FB4E1F|nr:uncharacterized protein LOC114930010 [Nylanderia fulva]